MKKVLINRIAIVSIQILSCTLTLIGQQSIQLRGSVVDQVTGKTLPGAHLIIKNKEVAAVSDALGHFSLLLNETRPNESILTSFVGYTTDECKISDYQNRNDSIIRLVPAAIELHEVVISAEKVDLVKLMETTARVYTKSKRKSPHIARGHYREKARINGRYVMFAGSIGYAVYNGQEIPHDGYSFFCENTRKSENQEAWKALAGNGSSGGKLSDVLASSGGAFQLFNQCENYGPISEKYWKAFSYHLDSTYFVNNQKLYGISFNKDGESGSIQVLSVTNQIVYINYVSKPMSGRPLEKTVTGDARIGFIYLDHVPFVSRISLHFNSGNLEYWNDYQMLMQKFGHFAFNMKEYYSMIWYAMVPYVEYIPKNWELHNIQQDSDYQAICDELRSGTRTLEQQFQANSGKWWLPDYQKMSMGGQGAAGFTNQVELSRDLIGRLKRFF